MKPEILFVSDIHICLEKPAITRRFLDFLKHRAADAQAVYILGDLFDAWVGDDDFTPPAGAVRRQLKRLTASGTKVYLQQGNRDFLLGERFFRDTGIVPLGDYAVIDLFGVPTLLTHGDLLCTDDVPYQAFRAKSRTAEWQRSVLSKPLPLRLAAARWYRFRSFLHKRNKSADIMDVNHDTVIRVMREFNCCRLIHGHTHRPMIHDFDIDRRRCQRIVLSDWKPDAADVLSWSAGGCRIERI